jgi:hypothetical protein
MADGVSPVIDTNLGPAPLGAAGAVGLMSDLAEMRNRQNANLLFQQQMLARHQLGEDMAVWSAQGLSPEQRVEKAAAQPYGVFVTPELANYRASNLAGVEIAKTQADTAEVRTRMVNAGMGPLAGALAATGGDPTKFDTAFKVATAGYPPELQGDMAKVYPAIKQSLVMGTDGLSPEAAKAKVIENTRNLGLAYGLDLAKGYAMTNDIAPQAVPMPGGGVSKVGGQGDSVTPALVPVQPSETAAPVGGSPLVGGASPPAPVRPKALDGSPLFAPDSALPPQYKTNLTGTKTFQSPQSETIADESAKAFAADQPRYEQVAQSNATIGNMLDEFRTSAKNGGFLTPGFAGESRTMMANAVNTAYAWFHPGEAPPLDPTKVAANEAAMKNAHQLAFQVVSNATGQSREALGTLQMGYNSVPNMDRTPLGNIVVGEVLQATGNWLLQKQQFMRDWASRTGGDLTNAEAEYLKEHPPEKVMSAALGAHGIGPDGYTSRAAFLKDFHDGLLTSGKEAPLETAATIAHDKGWISDEQYNATKAGGFKTLGGSPPQ